MGNENVRADLRSALRQSEQTGSRIKKRYNKKEFSTFFPKFGTDPLIAFLPENFVLDITPMESITVGELRELCLAKKDHPLAVRKALETQGFADSHVVHLLKEDLAILRSSPRKKRQPAAEE